MNLVEQTENTWIEMAEKIARRIHADQRRKDGRPYIQHLERVAEKCPNRLKPIAWLHDSIEDQSDKVSLEYLKTMGFPSYIINAIDLLTHRNREPNISYWTKILSNPDAVAVKIIDIKDNLGDAPSDRAKLKYAQALQLFKKAGYSVD